MLKTETPLSTCFSPILWLGTGPGRASGCSGQARARGSFHGGCEPGPWVGKALSLCLAEALGLFSRRRPGEGLGPLRAAVGAGTPFEAPREEAQQGERRLGREGPVEAPPACPGPGPGSGAGPGGGAGCPGPRCSSSSLKCGLGVGSPGNSHQQSQPAGSSQGPARRVGTPGWMSIRRVRCRDPGLRLPTPPPPPPPPRARALPLPSSPTPAPRLQADFWESRAPRTLVPREEKDQVAQRRPGLPGTTSAGVIDANQTGASPPAWAGPVPVIPPEAVSSAAAQTPAPLGSGRRASPVPTRAGAWSPALRDGPEPAQPRPPAGGRLLSALPETFGDIRAAARLAQPLGPGPPAPDSRDLPRGAWAAVPRARPPRPGRRLTARRSAPPPPNCPGRSRRRMAGRAGGGAGAGAGGAGLSRAGGGVGGRRGPGSRPPWQVPPRPAGPRVPSAPQAVGRGAPVRAGAKTHRWAGARGAERGEGVRPRRPTG